MGLLSQQPLHRAVYVCPSSQDGLEDPAGGVGLTCPAADRGSQSSPFAFVDGWVKLLCGARVEPGDRPSSEAPGAPRLRPTEGAKAVTASKRPHIAGGSASPRCRGSRWVLSFLRAPAEPPAPSCPPLSSAPRPCAASGPPTATRRNSTSLERGGRLGESPEVPPWRRTRVSREEPRRRRRAGGCPGTQCRTRNPVPQPPRCPARHCLRSHRAFHLTARAHPTAGTYARRFARALNFSQTSVYRLANRGSERRLGDVVKVAKYWRGNNLKGNSIQNLGCLAEVCGTKPGKSAGKQRE